MSNLLGSLHGSPDGQKIAYTYFSKDLPARMFSYPITGLNIFYLKDETIRQLIPLKDQILRYPFWSTDSQYLTVWINDGESSKIINSGDGSNILEIVSSDTTKPVSPIVFVPSQDSRVAYIQNGELVEADVNDRTRDVVLANLKTTRFVHEGPPLPNPPYYSSDGNYVAVYFQNNDLAILDKTSNKTKILAKGRKMEELEGDTHSGNIIGFNRQNNFIYYIIGQGGYQHGTKPPVYIYLPNEDKTVDLPFSSSTGLDSLALSPDLEKVVAHSAFTGQGLNIHSSKDGKLIKDCSKIDFRYSFYTWGGGPDYSLLSKVWSADGKYLISDAGEKLKVINTETCEVSVVSDEGFNLASWIP